MIPNELVHFLYIVILSFLVGLELKAYRLSTKRSNKPHLGSTRTFTFIGIIGYIFFKIDMWLYIVGYLVLGMVYIVYFIQKLHQERYSIISFLLLSIVYSFGPTMELFGIWMPTLLFVLIVFILTINKASLSREFFEKIDVSEFETLGKFLLLSAVILPLLPRTPLPFIGISAFKIWLVVVIVSAISYGSYITQKYIFKNNGFLIAGILGGLYSSTAVTVVFSKKSETTELSTINAAIIIATAMMYIRIWILSFIFNHQVALKLMLPLFSLAFIGIAIALVIYKRSNITQVPFDDRNPLELGTAFVFGLLFIAMMLLTKYVWIHFGHLGIKILSFIIGFTDIDPFILSLLTGKEAISLELILSSILIAIASNNFLKAIYALMFGQHRPKIAAFWLIILGIMTLAISTILERISL